MATYKSKPTIVNRNAAEIFDRFSNMNRMQEILDQLPEQQRKQIGDVEFTEDSMKIVTPQVGEIIFKIKDRIRPSKIVRGTESSPVPLTMEIDIDSHGEEQSEVTTAIDVQIPAIVRPIIGPKLQEAADKFGELISGLTL